MADVISSGTGRCVLRRIGDRTRCAQRSLGLTGAFCPTVWPLLRGSQVALLPVVLVMVSHRLGALRMRRCSAEVHALGPPRLIANKTHAVGLKTGGAIVEKEGVVRTLLDPLDFAQGHLLDRRRAPD